MTRRKDQGGFPPTGFGAKLRKLREEKKWSQQDLAVRAGLSVYTVAKLERAAQEPAWAVVLYLAYALRVSTAAFEPEDSRPFRVKYPIEDDD